MGEHFYTDEGPGWVFSSPKTDPLEHTHKNLNSAADQLPHLMN